MQTTQTTFDAYALTGYDDIWNPVDNIIAAAIYAQDTYGGLDVVVSDRCGGSCWYGY
jgi:SLT domain-containing protein